MRAVPGPSGPPEDSAEFDWGYKAHQAGMERLDLCDAWSYHNAEMDGGEVTGEPPPTEPDPSCGPYDGCQTCVVREVLDAAWPIIEEAVLARLHQRLSS